MFSYTEMIKMIPFRAEGINVLSFDAENTGKCRMLRVSLDPAAGEGVSLELPVNGRAHLDIPFMGKGDMVLTLSATGPVAVTGERIEARTEEKLNEASLPQGITSREPVREMRFTEKDALSAPCNAISLAGRYAYTIGQGRFSVVDLEEKREVGHVDGLGPRTRQLALLRDPSCAIVTAREAGVWLIDAGDPAHPRVRAKYDPVEYATGICVSGDYAFIGQRTCGVEIVDVSDPDCPRHVRRIRMGEVQSCRVFDGVLYCGIWGDRRVDMYDIHDLSDIRKIGSAPLTGKGDGLTVYRESGRTYLAAATGHHDISVQQNRADDPRFGMGNGADLFDVTDPARPVWLSSVRTKGRYYFLENDYWACETVVGSDGHRYLVLNNTYTGATMWNIDDPERPMQVSHMFIAVGKESPRYRRLTCAIRDVVLPYDQEREGRDVVGCAIPVDGGVLVAGLTTGLYFAREKVLRAREGGKEKDILPLSTDLYDREGYDRIALPGQVYRLCEHEGKVYAACGNSGILLVEPETGEYRKIAEGLSMDIDFSGKVLASAGRQGGLEIYDMLPDGSARLRKVYFAGEKNVREVRLSNDARYAVITHDGDRTEAIDLSDGKTYFARQSVGLLYMQNLSRFPAIDSVIVHSHLREEWQFAFDASGVRLLRDRAYSPMTMYGGACEAGEKGIYNAPDGIAWFDPRDIERGEASGMYVPLEKNMPFGKPCAKDGILVISDRHKGFVRLYDNKGETPRLIRKISTDANPAEALFTEKYILIPMGYGGIMRIGR